MKIVHSSRGFKPLYLLLLFLVIITTVISDKVEYKMTQLDSPPEDLIWCGKTKDTIIILTENATVYKSNDKGINWANLNDVFIEKAKGQQTETDKIGIVRKMIQSPVDPSLIIFLGTEGFSWVTENCGKDVTALLQGRPISQFIFHPTERNWALASAFSQCDDYVNEPCRIVKELFVTTTLGADWKIIGDYIIQFSWGIKDAEQIKAGIPKERIIVTYQPRGKGTQTFEKKWNYKVDLVYSDDFFETKVVGVRKGNRFLLTSKYLYVAQVIDQDTQEAQLLVANSYQKKYDFDRIITNQISYKEHSYSFLDTTEDSIFLYINTFGETSKYGNIYTSGDLGKEFSLSLKNNIQMSDYESDFENVRSVEGVYMANAISGKYIKIARQEMELAGSSQSINNQQQKPLANFKNFVKTLITFNRGGDWRRLKAPGVDSDNKSYDCGAYCYLHLHSYSSNLPQFYSVDSAAGLIIGNGNIGRYLDYSYTNMALFLSRDGGVNWYEIRKGVYIYEIGDHGGIIVIAKHNQPTRSVLYTLNEGMSWEELQISTVDIVIKNILIEPNSSTQHFLVYGMKKNDDGNTGGMVIQLDFATLQRPICSKNDYEIWNPTSGNENVHCLLGRKVSYSRRKRDSKCFMGTEFERKVLVEACPCTEDDYQCDIGYHRVEPGDPCTLLTPTNSNQTMNLPPENCSGYYTISKGYRKIAGNHCIKGAQFDPIKVSCPYNFFWVSLRAIFYLMLGGAIAWLIYVTFTSNNFQLTETITNSIAALKPMFSKTPESYLTINNIDEDNTIFENDPITDAMNEQKDVQINKEQIKVKSSKNAQEKKIDINNPEAGDDNDDEDMMM